MRPYHEEPPFVQLRTIKVEGADVFKMCYDQTGTSLACACTDGTARLYHAASGRLLSTYYVSEAKDGIRMPCTSVVYRPVVPNLAVKGVLIACGADGSIAHYRLADGLNMGRIEENQQYHIDEHEFYCMDVASDASMIAAAGKDLNNGPGSLYEGKNGVYVFDEQTKTLITRLMDGDGSTTCGHTSRIFSVKFLGEEHRNDIIASGGWDGTVQLWDLRTQKSAASLITGCISGDSISASADGRSLLIGSHIGINSGNGGYILAEYDVRRLSTPVDVISPDGTVSQRGVVFGEPKVVNWTQIRDSNKGEYPDETLIYCTAYGTRMGRDIFGACGYSPNTAKIFTSDGSLIGSMESSSPLYAMAFAPGSTFFAVSGAGGEISILNMK